MAGTATAVTTGDAIPLLDDNGAGQYIKGRNNARDLRVDLIGSLFQPGADGYTPKSGVVIRAIDAGDLLVTGQVTPNQTVLVRKGKAIVPRSGQAAYIFASEQDQTVPMPAASASNFRTDLVCAMVGDLGNFGSDAIHGPAFWVETGSLGGGVPATPTDMVKLAEVFRAANDNTISTEIADKRSVCGLQGAVNLVAGGDLANAGTTFGQLRDTGASIQRWSGSAWIDVVFYAPGRVMGKVRRTSNLAHTATEAVGDNITFTPLAGHSYEVTLCAEYSANIPSATALKYRTVAGTGPITTAATLRWSGTMPVPTGLTQGGMWGTTFDPGELGTSQITIGYTVQCQAGASSGTINGSANHQTTFQVKDVT